MLKIILLSIMIISSIPIVFAQETVPGNLPITSKPSDWIIVAIGIFGGLTSAGLGIAKNRANIKDNQKILNEFSNSGDPNIDKKVKDNLNGVLPTTLTFDPGKFARTLLVATITSILLAAGSAAVFTELNPITMIMIYAASIGMSSISKPGNK